MFVKKTEEKKHSEEPKDLWESILCTHETKVKLLGIFESRYLWSKTIQHSIKRSVKHGGGSVMSWGCFATSGPGRLDVIDGHMNSALSKKILNPDFWTSVCT